MLFRSFSAVLFSSLIGLCYGQFNFKSNFEPTQPPLPFPTCYADNVICLRRGIRTFFFLMDAGYLGMKPVDPTIVESVAVNLPEDQLSFMMRRVNVTGARWTKLVDRRFNLEGGKSSVMFSTIFHAKGEIVMTSGVLLDPYIATITIDYEVESNVTYGWTGERGFDNEDYIHIGQERIALRNLRTPTFFLEPNTFNSTLIGKVLELKPTILDHLTNEIAAAVLHTVVDNFRHFANIIAVRNYYKYY